MLRIPFSSGPIFIVFLAVSMAACVSDDGAGVSQNEGEANASVSIDDQGVDAAGDGPRASSDAGSIPGVPSPGDENCVAQCAGKECGDDGCGGSCGECPDIAPYCVAGECAFDCTPQCGNNECGDDGCGGQCGACVEGSACQDGTCVCAPSCDGKECGDDGCGGTCGTCGDEGLTCVGGVCSGDCTPDCVNKECGDDSCGGDCGQCPTVAPYCVEHHCAFDCVPQCGDKGCGDDGCGGSCGPCGADEACVSGECLCAPDCDEKTCGDDGCGGSCGDCPAAAPYCIENVCESECTPQCGGKECGPDGCGGSCGDCPDVAPVCGDDGLCQFACTPDCEGKACGDDGCGGSCGDCPQQDCMVYGCEPGLLCNQDTKLCEEDPAMGPGDACTSCVSGNVCPLDWPCIAISSGMACLPPCESDNDCATGWSCQLSPPVCVPGGFTCTGCVVEGCATGLTCDTNSGVCVMPTPLCESCSYDWQCGAGNACSADVYPMKLCKPRCADDAGCDANATCAMDGGSGLEICMYTGPSCCYGAACEAGCGGETPFMGSGQCVECLNNTHCAEGTCHPETHSCNSDPFCDTCTSPYPGCVELSGESYCVQCASDSHCGSGTCDLNNYMCGGGSVSDVQCGADAGGATCDAGTTDFTLYCHETGLCVDADGRCDNVTAGCPYGNACVNMLDVLGGSGGLPGGLPGGGLPGDTGLTLEGTCACDPANGDADCPPGVACEDMGFILSLYGGGAEDTHVCGGCTNLFGDAAMGAFCGLGF